MKSIFSMILLALLGWSPVLAQKKTGNEKVNIHIEKEVNGKTTEIDTVFGSKKDADAWLEKNDMTLPVPPVPPVPPVAGTPPPPRAPKSPAGTKKIRKEVRIADEGNHSGEKVLAFAYTLDDENDSTGEGLRMKRFEMDMPDLSFDLPELRQFQHSSQIYRLDFSLDEPGSARITVQKDGKTLYEESLEDVSGDFHRDFDRKRYEGATLQLNVQSGKSKQSRKLIL